MAKLSLFERRRRRVRTALRNVSGGRPRLSVHRTGQHIYAQIIDDAAGKTVAAASTLGASGSGANVDAAQQVGNLGLLVRAELPVQVPQQKFVLFLTQCHFLK